jgi:hypothetical protein
VEIEILLTQKFGAYRWSYIQILKLNQPTQVQTANSNIIGI